MCSMAGKAQDVVADSTGYIVKVGGLLREGCEPCGGGGFGGGRKAGAAGWSARSGLKMGDS